jgi:SAM-dependent methyltransferase
MFKVTSQHLKEAFLRCTLYVTCIANIKKGVLQMTIKRMKKASNFIAVSCLRGLHIILCMKTIGKFFSKLEKRHDFFPKGFWGVFINPAYFTRKGLLDGILKHSDKISGCILDIGCGNRPYESLFSCDTYVGMDVQQTGHDHSNEKIDVFYDGIYFPFANESFESLVSFSVFEHVFNPEMFLRESHRVLKPHGFFLLTMPFLYNEHEKPYDFARYTSFGMRHLFESNGFEVVAYDKTMPGFYGIFQLLSCYFDKMLIPVRKIFLFNFILTVFFLAPLRFLGLFLGKFLPVDSDLYLDNVILARKKD